MANIDQALNNLQTAIKTAAGLGTFALDANFLNKGLADPEVKLPEKYDDIIGQAFQIKAVAFLIACHPEAVGPVTNGSFTISSAQLPFIGSLLNTAATLVFSSTTNATGDSVLVVQILSIPANWSWGSSFPFMGGWPFDQLDLSAVQFIFSTADGVYPWAQNGGTKVFGGARQNLIAQVPLPALAVPMLVLFPGLSAPTGNLTLTGALNMGLYDGTTFETGTLMPSGNISASLSNAEFDFAGYLKVSNPSLTLSIPEPVAKPEDGQTERLLWDAETQALLADVHNDTDSSIDVDLAPTLALTCDLKIEGVDISTYQLAVMLFPNEGPSASYSVALTAGEDGPPLSPAVAISLIGGGGSYFRATPAVLQQFLSSFGLDGMSISGALTAPPSITDITLQLGSVPGLNWQPIPAPTPALSFTITSFFLNWAVSQPFKKPRFTYQFGSTFKLLPTVFKNMDGTDGGEFQIQFNSALLFEAGFDGKASLSDFFNVVSNGAVSLPSTIQAELSNIKLALDGTAQSFEFSSDFEIELSFLTVGNYPILKISGGAVSLSGLSATAPPGNSNVPVTTGSGTAWAGQVSGLLGIGPLQANCVVAYDGQQTPARWNLSAELSQPLEVQEVIRQFFAAGGIYEFPDFLPGDLRILSFAIASTIPTGKPSQALATSYSIDTSFSWKFKFGEQQVFGLDKATIGVKYDGGKPPAQQFSGSATTTWIYSAINLKLTFGYSFQPTEQGPNNILFVTWEGFTASYTTNTQMLSFTMKGWSLGTLIQSLVRTLGDPYFTLPSPWDLLNQISLDGLAINVSLKDGVQNRLSGSYTLSKPLNLGFITINKLILTRDTDGKVMLALDATVPPLLAGTMGPLIDPSKGQNVQNMPQVPGQGSSYFKVFLLVLGQRVSIYGSPGFDSTAAVIKALQNVPSTTGKDNPVNPGTTQPGQPYYNANSNWLIAAHLGVLQTAGVWAVDLQLVFNDPNLYGMRLALGSPKMGGLAGLIVDILYKKITDDIGLFQIDFTFPDSIRNLNFGAVSVVLPMIGIKIYTNGDFVIDIGFPYNLDFSRSFSFSAIVYGVPVLGSGGVYFGKLSSATATQVPKTELGSFNPVIIFGLGLQIGLGYNFVKGPLKAGFALTVFGIIEGVIATYRPYDGSDNLPAVTGNTASVQESHYFKLKGTVGVIGLLYGEVDLKIISASLLVNITVSVQIVYESYRAIPLSVTASVKISLKVKIDLGIFSFSISVSFSATVSAKFVIGSDSRAPWDKARQLKGGHRSHALPASFMHAVDTDRYARPMRLAPEPVKPKLNLYVSPQFTVLAPEKATTYQQQQGAFVCLLAMDAPDSTSADGGSGTSSFELLCKTYFPWLLNLLQSENTFPDQPLQLPDALASTVSRDKLESDMNWLGNSANVAFTIKELLQFLRDGFDIDILPATQLASATLFPGFDGLILSVPAPDGGSDRKTITLETYVTANATYRKLVADSLREVAANVASRQGAPEQKLLQDETAESMAAFIFVDVFTLIGRALLQAGIDVFNNYAYPLTSAQSINDILTTLNGHGNLLDVDDIALPNADYKLTTDLPITLSQLSATIQSRDDLNTVAARYTDSTTQRWVTTPTQLIIANPDARILRPNISFTVVIGNVIEPYTTTPGDSFGNIASVLQISLTTLSTQSVLYSLADLLLPTGQIAIPDLRYKTASDTLNSIAAAFAISVSSIAQSNRSVPDLFAKDEENSHLAIANLDALPVSQIWDAIHTTGAVGQVAAQVARFVTYGLRLPKADGLDLSNDFLYPAQQQEYALYQLTGQQFPVPDAASAYSITLSRADESHDINLDFIKFNNSNETKIDVKLDDAYTLLSSVLSYARSGKFLPSPSCEALPPVDFKPKQFVSSSHAVWNSSDQNRINQITSPNGQANELANAQSGSATPYLWSLPQAMLTSIQERQATLETIFDEDQYASLLPLLPAYLPRIGNTPPNSSKTVYTDMHSYAYASRVDFQITRLPASTAPSHDNSATLEAATSMATVYQVLGPSAADAQRLQFLLTAIAALGDNLVSGLFLLYNQGGTSEPSLISQADSEFLAFLTQTNLSTESNPPPSLQALFRAVNDVPQGIANTPSQFIKLLWEQSVVRGGGYYLYWQERASGTGLPASIFDATGTATLSLLVTIAHNTLPAGGRIVPNFVNAFVSNQNIDLQQDVVVLESQLASGDSLALKYGTTQSLSSLGLLYGVSPGRLAAANDDKVLSQDSAIPVTGIVHQLNQADAANPATALDRLAAYYATGMQPPLMTGANIASYNPGVSVAVGNSFVIPAFTYLVSASGPGNTFASMAAYYRLSPEALAAGAAQVKGIFPDGTVLDIETQVLTIQASQDPGNVAFVLERENPDSQQARLKARANANADDSPASLLYGLYNTLSAGLQTNPYFLSSPYSLPFGPQDYGDDDDSQTDRHASHRAAMHARSTRMARAAENDFEYRQALGYNGKNSKGEMFARINPAPSVSGPGLPAADANPYVGVGTYTSIALRWQDLFGNTTITPFELVPSGYNGALNNMPIPLHYTDRLIGISAWPKTQTTYTFSGTATNPALQILLRMDGNPYTERQDILNDLASYQSIYFQLNQDYTGLGVPGLSGNAVSMSLVNSLLSSPVTELNPSQAQIIRDYVAACAAYLQALLDAELHANAPNTTLALAPVSSLSLPISLAAIVNENLIALDVALVFTRKAELVTPQIAALIDGVAVSSAILPQADNKADTSSYTQFATALETCLQTADWYMKAGNGLTQAGNTERQQTQQIFAVRFGRSAGKGIYFQIAESAGYYAPLPISKSLSSNTVSINTYPDNEEQTLSFNGIDQNLWFENCLNAIDKFLSPGFAPAAFILDKINQSKDPLKDGDLGKVLAAKQKLADAISTTVSPILSTSAGDSSTLASAKETMRQQLLNTLGTAFSAGAVVVYGLEQVGGADGNGPSGPPALYGQPTAADGAGTSASAGKNQNYSLTPARIPLASNAGVLPRLAFNFVSKNVADQAYVALDMNYQITHMEFDRSSIPGIKNYVASQWLGFINGPLVFALGKDTQYIPVMNRALPVPPTANNQTAVASTNNSGTLTPADLAMWDYGFNYIYQQAAQDAIHINVVLNVPGAVQNKTAAKKTDLFGALAEFVTNYPAISADLDNYLVKIDGQTDDEALVKKATQATNAFQALVNQVADVYAGQFGLFKAAQATGVGSTPIAFDALLNSDANGNAQYEIVKLSISGVAATYDTNSHTVSNGFVTLPAPVMEILPQQYQATPVSPVPPGALFAYTYQPILPASGDPLSYDEAKDLSNWAVSVPGLNVMMYQNAQSSMYIQRNKFLFPLEQAATVQTMPEFLYQTPEVKFTDPILPLLSYQQYDLRQLTPPGGNDIKSYVSNFFEELFYGASGQMKLTMTGSYSYSLVPSMPDMARTSLPINLLPSTTIQIDPAKPPALAMALTEQVAKWYADNQPTTTGAASMDFGLKFFSASEPEQLLLAIDRLHWRVVNN